MKAAATLNKAFGIPGEVEFKVGQHGALVAEVGNAHGRATVACQGAQVLTWAPTGQPPVVWLSPAAQFTSGKSLRGGVPVCWPWFGAHPEDVSKPAHGFARNLDWQVAEAARLGDATRLVMRFAPGDAQRALWPHHAELTLSVTVSEHLRLDLTTRNTGHEPFTLTQALHTYFHVGDIASARVEGLQGCDYVDRLAADARVRQEGPVVIDREVDRIYVGCPGEVFIADTHFKRRIRITKVGSRSYVVWNPWVEKGAKFGDMGEGGYRRMLCVETTNAWDDTVTVVPGGSCTLATEYAVAAL
jgi:D-hexose-6-phosphate mutarotase